MPIKVHDNLPAKQILANENIYLIDESRAFHQDIRPLKIAILNLMPDKQATEVQLLRLLGNTPLQIDITLLYTKTHNSKNTSREYLLNFYQEFSQIRRERLDGLIITGAPVEQMEFEQVTYWNELAEIMEWSKSNVTSTLHICWGAQAGLYYHYKVPKYPLKDKMFGIFEHTLLDSSSALFRGFDDRFHVPQSRYTEVRREDILKINELQLLSESSEAGVYIVATRDLRQIFISGHSEYDVDTLKKEYMRDLDKGNDVSKPKNYYIDGDDLQPICLWKAHAMLLFSNWINHVYQETPYEFY